MPPQRTIRIFASSPSDVQDERETLKKVVDELSETLRAFVPAEAPGLELIRWETHTHPAVRPDAGPQPVVDAQLGHDYDIFVGIMWTRFGTPTDRARSGTEDELRTALEGMKRRGKPAHILFYFCEEMPSSHAEMSENAEQIALVRDFRKELSQLGLIAPYAPRTTFGDKVRRDLIQVISKQLHTERAPSEVAMRAAQRMSEEDSATARARVTAVARTYEEIREQMNAGPERTQAMERVASQLRTLAQDSYAFLGDLQASSSAGERLAAVAALQAFPDPEHLSWLSDRIAREKPFVGYHAAVALLAAARDLPDEHLDAVGHAVTRAEEAASRLRPDTDRAATLRSARATLERREARTGEPTRS